MERILRLLLNLGEVKNYTLYGRAEPRCPPIIVVCYRRVRAGAAEEVSRAFASYRGLLEWSFQAASGGWVVMPRRVPELAAERRLPGSLSGAEVLMNEEPTFAEAAREDLESLAAHVCGCLRREARAAEPGAAADGRA